MQIYVIAIEDENMKIYKHITLTHVICINYAYIHEINVLIRFLALKEKIRI